MLKKLGVLFLIIVMVFSFTACRKKKTENKEDNLTEIIHINADDEDDESEDTDKVEGSGQPENTDKADHAQNSQNTNDAAKNENQQSSGITDKKGENKEDTTQGGKADDNHTSIELPIIVTN